MFLKNIGHILATIATDALKVIAEVEGFGPLVTAVLPPSAQKVSGIILSDFDKAAQVITTTETSFAAAFPNGQVSAQKLAAASSQLTAQVVQWLDSRGLKVEEATPGAFSTAVGNLVNGFVGVLNNSSKK